MPSTPSLGTPLSLSRAPRTLLALAAAWVASATLSVAPVQAARRDVPGATMSSRVSASALDRTRRMIEAASRPGASPNDVAAAEADLVGDAWMALFGTSRDSNDLAAKFGERVSDAYNGTPRIHVYMNHTSAIFSRILNLGSGEDQAEASHSSDAWREAKLAVDKVLGRGPSGEDYRDAEAALMALGWSLALGNGDASWRAFRGLRTATAAALPDPAGYYYGYTAAWYDKVEGLFYEPGTAPDEADAGAGGYKATCPEGMEGCSTENQCTSCDASCGQYCQNTGGPTCGPQDCMTCPPGGTLEQVFDDGTGECQ